MRNNATLSSPLKSTANTLRGNWHTTSEAARAALADELARAESRAAGAVEDLARANAKLKQLEEKPKPEPGE